MEHLLDQKTSNLIVFLNQIFCRVSFLAFGSFVFAAPLAAQTLGGVFGPGVRAGDKTVEYRAGFIPGENGSTGRGVHRVHYQQSLNNRLRLRGVVQSTPGQGAFDFRHFQGELQWQVLKPTAAGLSSAVRFDIRLSDQAVAPHLLSANWGGQWDFAPAWSVRSNVLLAREFGRVGRSGVNLEARSQLARQLDGGYSVSLQSFHALGNSQNGFGRFDTQNHRLGPEVTGPIGNEGFWAARVLFGLSDRAADHDLTLRLGWTF